MNRFLRQLAPLVLCLGTTAVAAAAEPRDSPVQMIQDPSGVTIAYGSLGSTRNASGSTDYLGCWIENIGAHNTGGCSARAGSIEGQCVFPLDFEYFYSTLANLTPQSYIVVAWDGSGECQFLQISESSIDGPKVWP